MNNPTRSVLALLFTCALALSHADAQTTGLTDAQAAALEDQVDNFVREQGVLESASTIDLQSPIASTVLFLVEDGTRVKKGDKLVSLDSAAIEDQYANQRAKLATATVALIAAKSNVETSELKLRSAQQIGEKRLAVAEMKLESFSGEGGDCELTQQDHADTKKVVDAQIAAAATGLDNAKVSVRRGSPGPVNVKQAEAALVEAHARLAVLKREQARHELEKRIRIAELELAVFETKTNLLTTIKASESALQQAKTELEAAKIAEDIEQLKLETLKKKIEGCVLVAPQDGIVRYPERRRSADAFEVGATVRERQAILKVADLSKLQVAATVNETKVGRIQPGQEATIRFDAFGDRKFTGTVIRVNDTPEPTSFLQESGRKYKVIVTLGEPSPLLRIGMTAMVDIRTKK